MTLLNATIGQEIFLQNDFLSFALNGSGTLGTKASAPTGFATDTAAGYLRLGMVADTDGFGVGGAQTRDVMLAGTPVETFILGYKLGATKYVNVNSERDGKMDIKGVAGNLSDGDAASAGWVGATTQGIKVAQVMSLTEDAKFVRVDVTITNTTATAATDLRYMRSIDPDHGPSFNTNNVIVEQGGDGSNGALIAAYASNTSTPFYFYTQDDRAIVSAYGLENRDPYAAGAYDAPKAEGTGANADVAINMNFGLGTLAAGGSTTITYYMGVTDNLTTTIADINAAAGNPPSPPSPPVNHAPIATSDSLSVAAGLSGSGNVLTNDLDSDGNALQAALKAGPANGTLTLGANGAYTYTPKAGFSGSDSFTYTVSDGTATATGTVNLTVTPAPNKAPVAVADSLSVAANAFVAGNLLANDTDADGDALTATLKTGPANGTLTLTADGTYKYTPKAGYFGSDSFTYTLSDGKTTTTGTVSVTVAAPPNQGPVAGADSLSVTAGSNGTGNVLANDTDANGDALSATLKAGPAHGVVSLATDGTFTYTPTAGYTGTDSFSYTVSDGKDGATGVVTLSVTPKPNNGPVAVGESLNIDAGAVGVGNVLSNDSDADGDALQASVVTGSSHGVVAISADGAFTYTPNAGYSGADSFTYAVSDGQASSTATVTINVAPPPVELPPVELPPVELPQPPAPTLHDGSAAGTQIMVGGAGKDHFYFDTVAKSGADTIVGFGANDLLVTSSKLYDSNNDGLIGFQGNKLSIDAPKAIDTVVIGGVSALRLMGTDSDGNYLYANSSATPKGATVSKTSDDHLKGDAKDKKAQTFFFNTALDLDLGSDKITNFGGKDTIVTTSALKLDDSGHATASGGRLSLAGNGSDLFGDVTITDLKGAAVTQFDFDGSVDHGGLTYFVYSAANSTAFHTVGF